ncbi:MAG: MFS transporter [Anaerolineae bacterium]|nr:MFS transporter [Anaerolineae bacterium]
MNSETTMQADRSGKIAKTVVYYVAFIALGLVSASLGPTLLELAENTGSVLAQISYSFTARSLGYLIGSSQGGRVYDRLRGHPVQATMLLVMALTLCLAPLATRLWLLIAIWLITGTAEGMLDVGTNTLLMWVHKDKVGPFMNGLHFFFGVGAFLAPIVAAQVMLLTDSVRWVYWVIALLVSPVSVLFFRLPSPPIEGHKESDAPGRRGSTILVVCIALFFFLAVGIPLCHNK